MQDQVAAGLFILDGSARVRTDNGLVRLDQLSGSGPQGPPGPEGPTGPAGVDGTVDTSQFYNKSEVFNKTEVDFKLLLKQSLLTTHPGNGSRVWDNTNGMVRNLIGRNGIQICVHQNPTDPEDPENQAIIIDGQALQGGAGIDATVATFTDSLAQTAISLKQTSHGLSLDGCPEWTDG